VVSALCCDCVNGTGEAVIELVSEVVKLLVKLVAVSLALLLTLIPALDEELCTTVVDSELFGAAPVVYPARKVRSGVSVQKNDTAPPSV